MNNELISVIVPIYNVELYLEKCLDSIIRQTYNNLEIILVDDGSIDNSRLICDKYREKDERIVVIHKDNEGLSCARNIGLDIAKGNLISFVDGDDYIESNMFEILKTNMDLFSSDISICNIYRVKDKNKTIEYNNYLKENEIFFGKEKFDNIQNNLRLLTIVAWNKLYKKELFESIRFPNNKIYEDNFIICDLLYKAKKISYTYVPLYNYVYRDNSIVNRFSISHFDNIDAYNKNISFYNNKGYYDLIRKENKRKINHLFYCLINMKRYGIKNKKIENKYYKELVYSNKEIKWKEATKINKFYKVFRKVSIIIIAFKLKIKDKLKD